MGGDRAEAAAAPPAHLLGSKSTPNVRSRVDNFMFLETLVST